MSQSTYFTNSKATAMSVSSFQPSTTNHTAVDCSGLEERREFDFYHTSFVINCILASGGNKSLAIDEEQPLLLVFIFSSVLFLSCLPASLTADVR